MDVTSANAIGGGREQPSRNFVQVVSVVRRPQTTVKEVLDVVVNWPARDAVKLNSSVPVEHQAQPRVPLGQRTSFQVYWCSCFWTFPRKQHHQLQVPQVACNNSSRFTVSPDQSEKSCCKVISVHCEQFERVLSHELLLTTLWVVHELRQIGTTLQHTSFQERLELLDIGTQENVPKQGLIDHSSGRLVGLGSHRLVNAQPTHMPTELDGRCLRHFRHQEI
mmetsp:Transcript_19242/g.51405  ORF Transcript_19242/g.51405 Transcript_19242/m.51405 type:complete len:221 (+) Transcript_19242:217-879(+)